jgi:Lrp/AsnC family transcriptional regulator
MFPKERKKRMDVPIDELDGKILRTMQRDAGQSLDEIA